LGFGKRYLKQDEDCGRRSLQEEHLVTHRKGRVEMKVGNITPVFGGVEKEV